MEIGFLSETLFIGYRTRLRTRRRRRSCHVRRLLSPSLSYAEQVQPLCDALYSWLTIVLVQAQDMMTF
ncbi:hypothetical protein NC651_014981 [Populus alba x Populus x berolinensis]|nr:hypothetical protein NC651_014981 [Populus alba x Populus x berolinensis]